MNGESNPEIQVVRGQATRLRLINAANARIFEINPGRFGAKILAYDGQALSKPKYRPMPMLLGPAQRMDLLVTPDDDFLLEELSGDDPYPFVRFRTVEVNGTQQSAVSLPLNAIPEPDLDTPGWCV